MVKILMSVFFMILFTVDIQAGGKQNLLSLITFNQEIELMIEDAAGRRVGYDRIEGDNINGADNNIGTYYREYSDNNSKYYRELDYRNPETGLYKLKIYAMSDSIYDISLNVTDRNTMIYEKHIQGIIQKGDVQNIDIRYSNTSASKIIVKKLIDVDLIEKELNYAKTHSLLDNQITVWLENMKKAKEDLRANNPKDVKTVLNQSIEKMGIVKKQNEAIIKDAFVNDAETMINEYRGKINDAQLLAMIRDRIVKEGYRTKVLDGIIMYLGIRPLDWHDIDLRNMRKEHMIVKNKYRVLNDVFNKTNINLNEADSRALEQNVASYFNDLAVMPNLIYLIDNNLGMSHVLMGNADMDTLFSNWQRLVEIYPKTLGDSEIAPKSVTGNKGILYDAVNKANNIKRYMNNEKYRYIIGVTPTLGKIKMVFENPKGTPEDTVKSIIDMLNQEINKGGFKVPSSPWIENIEDILLYARPEDVSNSASSELQKSNVDGISRCIVQIKKENETEFYKVISIILQDTETLLESID